MKKYGLLMGALVLAGSLVAVPAQAIDYQLRQVIEPLDCTITETSNGSGTTINSDCPPQAPLVSSVQVNDGQPIIRGLFDAANAQAFRVHFLGVWYQLGVDAELTATGNVWTLNLGSLTPPLSPGSYPLLLQMTTHQDEVLEGQGVVIIPSPNPDPDPPVPHQPTPTPARPGTPAPGAPATGWLRELVLPGGLLFLLALGIIGVIVWRSARRQP